MHVGYILKIGFRFFSSCVQRYLQYPQIDALDTFPHTASFSTLLSFATEQGTPPEHPRNAPALRRSGEIPQENFLESTHLHC